MTMPKRKLHLGCGVDIKKGYINLDKAKAPGVDGVHDLSVYPWPFKNNYFDEVYSQDVIEHVDDLWKTMKEIQRICRKGATVRIIVPYWHSSAAFYPDHNYYFNIDSFKFFTNPTRLYDSHYCVRLIKVKDIPSKFGWLIPPIPLPKKLFPNALHLRHLMSYLLGEIVLKLDFEFKVMK